MGALNHVYIHEIANALRAVACANEGVAQEIVNIEQLEAYRRGVRNTLLAVGLAFGLEPIGPTPQRGQVTPGLAGLLWAESSER